MKFTLRLTIYLTLFGLYSCGTLLKPYVDPVPVGTNITLNKAIEIPASAYSVIIQNGEIRRNYDQYNPYCEFSIIRKGNNIRSIQPDTFRVIKVNYDELADSGSVKYVFNHGSLDGVGHVISTTILYLSSPRQPQVYQLECSEWQQPNEAEYLTRTEMQKTLGKLFTIGN